MKRAAPRAFRAFEAESWDLIAESYERLFGR
jgi:hypothetical protein